MRAKLDDRYHLGIYLGQVPSSNECDVATANGGAIRTQSVARVVSSVRWDAQMALNIKGIPTHLNLGDPKAVDFEEIEASEDPQRHADDAEREILEDDQVGDSHRQSSREALETLDRQIRNTNAKQGHKTARLRVQQEA